MKKATTILLILYSFTALAQNTKIVGRINDSINKEPIPFVNIMIDGTKFGCSSDSTGYFTLIVPGFPAEVTISHIFYKTKKVQVNNRRDLRRVLLTPHVYMLKDAIVKPVVNITKGLLFDIIDYEFWGDSILLSGYCYKYPKEQNPWLLTINTQGDTLNKQIIGNEGTFYEDCMNNIHYLTKNTAFQLHIESDSFIFINNEPRNEFEKIMYPCKFETKKELIFQTYAGHNQIIDYYAVNKNNKECRNILSVDDPTGLRMLADRGRFNSMGNNKPTKADVRFEEMCFFDSIYSPLFQIKDSIFFFDLMNDHILCYDNNFNLIRETHCTLHHFKDFKEEIIIDEKMGKAYGLYQRTGFTYVREVNLINGMMLKSYKIPNFQWISKIRIHDNRLYFLYRKKFTGDLISLYRMKLDTKD